MPITIQWDNDDKTILRCILEGIWNWNELIGQHAAMKALFDEACFPRAIIIDMSESNYVPSESVKHFKLLLTDFYPQTELVIFVGANTYFQKLIGFHTRSVGTSALQIHHTADLETAHGICTQAQSDNDRSSSDAATTC